MILLICFFVTVAQVSIANLISIEGGKPNLTILVIVILSLKLKGHSGLTYSAVIGIMEDLFSLSPFGINALTKIIIGFTLDKIKKNLVYGMLAFLVLSLSACFLDMILFSIFNWFFNPYFEIYGFISISSFTGILYTGILSLSLVPIIQKMNLSWLGIKWKRLAQKSF